MAKLNGDYFFKGSLGNLTVYKMKGVEQPVVRRKGGPSKEKVKSGENFLNTRRRNSEFGGRAVASRWIMRALHHQKPMADYNIAGPLNVLMMPLQAADDGHYGQRAVKLSHNPDILKGFSLNRNTSFDAIVRTGLEYYFDGPTAMLVIPELRPTINFFPSPKYPWFRLVASLGLVPDLYFTKNGQPVDDDYDTFNQPEAKNWQFAYAPVDDQYEQFEGAAGSVTTPWFPVKKGMPPTTSELWLESVPAANEHTLLLSVGIQYGIQQEVDVIDQAPHAGAAKILALK